MTTPADDVAQRLSIPLGCGWRHCEDICFDIEPFPSDAINVDTGLYPMQEWEAKLAEHDERENHSYRKLRELPVGTKPLDHYASENLGTCGIPYCECQGELK